MGRVLQLTNAALMMACLGLPACGSEDSGGTTGSGGSAGAIGGGGKGGEAPYQACSAGVYCNGACLSAVGEEAGGCKLLLDTIVDPMVVDDALYYGAPAVTVGKLDMATWASTTLVGPVFWRFGLTLDATHAYFASLPEGSATATVRIEKVPRTGGAVELVLNDIVTEEGLDHLRIMDGGLFYRNEGTFGPGPLMRVEGASAVPVLSGADILDFASDGAHVYYVESTGVLSSSINRAPVGALDTTELLVADAGNAEEIAVLGDRVYWLSSSTLYRAPKSGGTAELAFSFDGIASIGASDATALYIVTHLDDATRLWRFAAQASAPVQLARVSNGGGLDLPAVATDASYVYVSPPGAILRVSK